jgi:hypothetical protein
VKIGIKKNLHIEKVDPWGMVKNGDFRTAEAIYLNKYEETRDHLYLFQLGHIKVIQNEIPEAIKLIERSIIETDVKLLASTPYLYLSVCYWILADYQKFMASLEKSFITPYTDTAGGVVPSAMLLYAGLRLNDQETIKVAKNRLSHLWKLHFQMQNRILLKAEYSEEDFVHPGLLAWPGMITPYLLGKSDEKDVFKDIEKKYQEPLKSRYTCQFNFYQGIVGLMKNNDQQFKNGMLKCADSNNGLLVHEYFLARWERDNNFPEKLKAKT